MAREETKRIEAKKRAERRANLDPAEFATLQEYYKAASDRQVAQGRPRQVSENVKKALKEKWLAVHPEQAPKPAPTPSATATPSTPTPSATFGPALTPGTQISSPAPIISSTTGGGFVSGETIASRADQERLRALVTDKNSFENGALVNTDPVAYANFLGKWVLDWRNTASPVPGYTNKLDYIQDLLRLNGSGGTSPRGILDSKDQDFLKEISKSAYRNGVPFDQLLVDTYRQNHANASAGGATSFSKTITSSVKLLNLADSLEKLSNAYFNAYGVFPTMAQVNQFKNMWNQRAQATEAQSKTIQTTTTTGGAKPLVGAGGKSSITDYQIVQMGQGFDAAQQARVVSDFLTKQFGKQVKDIQDLGGKSLEIYRSIADIYRNNYQAVPTFSELAPIISDLVSTSDDKVYQTKLDKFSQKVRDAAAIDFPAASNWLTNGNNLSTIGSQRLSTLSTLWGMPLESLKYNTKAQNLIKDSLNYKDKNGNTKIADDAEFKSMAQSTSEFVNSPNASKWATDFVNLFAQAVGR